jgi:hypothetical protein
VASAGSYAIDFTQGYPGGRYASLALRLAPQRDVARRLRAADGAAAPSARAAARITVATIPDRRRALRVSAPGARTVEVMGDFTGWQPVALQPSGGGWWRLVTPLTPGTYQMNVRLDGGAWEVPAGSLESVDEFGVRVGVVLAR